jgi:pyruvate dehydrogenase kinase 2/3/4
MVVRGEDDLTIRIADRGGGMPRRVKDENLFTYLYSTAQAPEFFERAIEGDDAALTDMNNAPLAGFGYGLPISRLYAR